MTEQKSFKRLVRSRMEKTGESYTAARRRLLADDGPARPDREEPASEPVLTMSDEAIRRRTGRGWEQWFDLLDEAGAAGMSHTEIARWLREQADASGWDAQGVTVSYERVRGMRAVGERPDGFSVTAQRTIAVPVEILFDAFVDPGRRSKWMPEAQLTERTSTRPRSARFDWEDGRTRLTAGFTVKGDRKSSVAIEHQRLADAAEAERIKGYWRLQLGVLKRSLE